jgi:hypothetical protein
LDWKVWFVCHTSTCLVNDMTTSVDLMFGSDELDPLWLLHITALHVNKPNIDIPQLIHNQMLLTIQKHFKLWTSISVLNTHPVPDKHWSNKHKPPMFVSISFRVHCPHSNPFFFPRVPHTYTYTSPGYVLYTFKKLISLLQNSSAAPSSVYRIKVYKFKKPLLILSNILCQEKKIEKKKKSGTVPGIV